LLYGFLFFLKKFMIVCDLVFYEDTEMILFNKNYYLEGKTHRCKIQNRKKKEREKKTKLEKKKIKLKIQGKKKAFHLFVDV